jgi:hypothetical protein
MVRSASVDMTARFVEGTGRVLGRLTPDGLVAGGVAPFAQAVMASAAAVDIASITAAAAAGSTALAVGSLVQADVPARLRAAGFSRHTFLCGQSGSGKTYSMGVLLEQLLLETTLPMVIVDPNSDHVHLGELRSTADLNRGRERPLSKRDEAALRRRHGEAGRVVVARRGTGADMPLQIHLSDLTIGEQALTLGLDPVWHRCGRGRAAGAARRTESAPGAAHRQPRRRWVGCVGTRGGSLAGRHRHRLAGGGARHRFARARPRA